MKILWMSNSPSAPTGYGKQTALFTRKIKEDHELFIFSFYGREGGPVMNPDGIIELSRFRDGWGNDIVGAHYAKTGSEAIITLVDPFVHNGPEMEKLNWVCYVPIDSHPMKHMNASVLKHAKRVIAMSKFGRDMLEAEGFENVLYMPHAYDGKKIFPMDKAEARAYMKEKFDVPEEGELIIDISNNKGRPSRKNFIGLFQAFTKILDARSNVSLYIHTDPQRPDGEDLNIFIKKMGLEGRVFFPNKYEYLNSQYDDEDLNHIFNAADCMLHMAYGEGFGVPALEAQAVGVPVIQTNGTAMKELTFIDKFRIDSRPYYAGVEGSFMDEPDVDHAAKIVVDYLSKARVDAEYKESVQNELIQKASEYEIDAVYDRYTKPILEGLERDYGKRRDGDTADAG